MANNQYINKVVYGNQTLMDLTSDTVAADKLLRGYTAHDASGASIVGTYEGGGGEGYTINLTASSSELYGQSIVVSYEGQRVTTIQFSNAGTASIVVQEEGAYNFAVSYGGLTYYCDVNVISAVVTYNETIYYYPNGSTVTPVNDVQIWISCADVRDRGYTTLAEVFADTQLLATLMASENAVNYLVRSKQFIKSQALVPTMTSNTTPSGECFGDSFGSDYPYYQAFDGNNATYWCSSNLATNNQYLGYDFGSNTGVAKFQILLYQIWTGVTETFNLQYSDDKITWVDASESFTDITDGVTLYTHNANTYSKHRYWRVNKTNSSRATSFPIYTLQFIGENGFTENETAMQYIGANDYASDTLLADSDWNTAIQNSTYFESVDNVKVPVMTSDTTPSGECFAGQESRSDRPAYFSFNGNPSDGCICANYALSAWVGYDFGSAKKIYAMGLAGTDSSRQYRPSYSDDKSIWNDYSVSFNTDGIHILNINGSHRYWRLIRTSTSTTTGIINEVQFYGRQNGGVQTWLRLAGITDKLYTTLSEVFADTETLSALMANKDAVDYLVTCKGWATEICSNENAMIAIGKNNYCANTLLADESWCNAICSSTYFESVLNVKAPKMTSDTTPSGVCSASSVYGVDNPAWKGFDGIYDVIGDSWCCANGQTSNQYLAYEFTSSEKIYSVKLHGHPTSATWNPKNIKFQYYDNGSWVDVPNSATVFPSTTDTQTYVYSTPVESTKHRLYITDSYNSSMVHISLLQFYGRKDVTDVPDGKTVLPTDDVQIWLQCAEIDKPYTTLTEVLADSSTLEALINNENAVDYLVRSKSFAKSEALVPTMTSNNTPSGNCYGSPTAVSGFEFYKAFDGNNNTYYSGGTDIKVGDFLGYNFQTNVKCGKVYIRGNQLVYPSNTTIKIVGVKYEGGSYVDYDIKTNIPHTTSNQIISFENSEEYIAYKFVVTQGTGSGGNQVFAVYECQFYSEDGLTENATAMEYIGANNYASDTLLADLTWCNAICNSTYFESVLNVKVPKMTDNTHPSGECFGTTAYSGNEFYKAFDGNDSTEYMSNASSTSGYIGYKFASKVKIYMCKMLTNTNSEQAPTYTYKLQSSDDDFATVNEITGEFNVAYNLSRTPVSTTKIFASAVENISFRLFKTTTSYRIRVEEIQFYGRKDVVEPVVEKQTDFYPFIMHKQLGSYGGAVCGEQIFRTDDVKQMQKITLKGKLWHGNGSTQRKYSKLYYCFLGQKDGYWYYYNQRNGWTQGTAVSVSVNTSFFHTIANIENTVATYTEYNVDFDIPVETIVNAAEQQGIELSFPTTYILDPYDSNNAVILDGCLMVRHYFARANNTTSAAAVGGFTVDPNKSSTTRDDVSVLANNPPQLKVTYKE